MPERRTVNRSISTNYRVAQLPEPAQKLFTWMIIWADVDGRLTGDADLIKSTISPKSTFTVEEVNEWLDLMWSLKDVESDKGLIERYEIKGQKYIYLPGFEGHQSGRIRNKNGNIREAKSHIPPPPKVTKQPETEPIKTNDLKVAAMVEYYEKSIGRVLTPGDLKKLSDFADTYPNGLFEKTVDEYPGKPLSYLEKVMENKQKEGKSGTHRQGTRQLRSREAYTPSPDDDL